MTPRSGTSSPGTSSPGTSPLWFLGPLLAIYGAAFYIVEILPQATRPDLVAGGLTIDLVVLVPALFYVVLVRGRGWPSITLAPVFLLSVLAAFAIIPADHDAVLQAIGYGVPAVELVLLGFVGYKAWRIIRARRHETTEPDIYRRMRAITRDAFDVPVVAHALAYEVSVFRYAFSGRRSTRPSHGLSYHGEYTAVFYAILIAAGVELIAGHVLLSLWSSTAAIVHLVLGAYGVVWFVGDYRAMRRRPHELRPDVLRLHCGLRWEVEVPWSDVDAVRRTRRAPSGDDTYLSTVPIGDPRYVVSFRHPVEAIGPYGLTREITSAGLRVDDARAFEARLKDLGAAVQA